MLLVQSCSRGQIDKLCALLDMNVDPLPHLEQIQEATTRYRKFKMFSYIFGGLK